jgi:hypothetical protein
MQIMAKKGFIVSNMSVDVETFCTLPYVFVTNVLMGMVPVRRINNTIFEMDRLICRQVNEMLFSAC